ncbi:hypothetical protein GUJ93_ZPchr0012g21645 [Zizania palustris]|uniref:Uncharacterized protein n=1 Tax=Zizania palustris TaxID=103762 RepID=A0A8J5WVH2_ZIZPA|nr:hypothetical protein GUJ93_ZPchr0012g21645 [Zizania palustris]
MCDKGYPGESVQQLRDVVLSRDVSRDVATALCSGSSDTPAQHPSSTGSLRTHNTAHSSHRSGMGRKKNGAESELRNPQCSPGDTSKQGTSRWTEREGRRGWSTVLTGKQGMRRRLVSRTHRRLASRTRRRQLGIQSTPQP